MYKVFKFGSLKSVFPLICQPVASFARLSHATEWAEKYADANVTYITAFCDYDANGIPVIIYSPHSTEASNTENFDRFVPWWEGGKAES